jgi:hypothetical protein
MTSSTCRTCSLPVTGNYCAHCGQKVIERFNIAYLWKQLHSELFELDRGLWITARDLTLRPGYMIRDYLGGKTRIYYGPLKYLLIWITVLYLTLTLSTPDWKEGFESMKNPKSPFMSEFASEAIVLMFDNLTLYFLLLIPTLGLSLKLFFRALNPVEHVVALAYMWGHVMLMGFVIGLIMAIPVSIWNNDVVMYGTMMLTMGTLFGFFSITYKQLTGGTLLKTIFKLIAAVVMGYWVFLGFAMLTFVVVRQLRG